MFNLLLYLVIGVGQACQGALLGATLDSESRRRLKERKRMAVYVDIMRGSDESQCGSARWLACKTLSGALKHNVAEGGVIYIRGNYYLDIVLQDVPGNVPQYLGYDFHTKNITIASDPKRPGVIIGAKNKPFALGIMSSITLNLVNLFFYNTGVLRTSYFGSSISMNNVYVANSPQEVLLINDRISLNISNSVFENTFGLSLKRMENIRLDNCSFTRHDSLKESVLLVTEAYSVSVTNCHFKDGYTESGEYSTFLHLKDIRSSVYISGCSFLNGTKRVTYGGCMAISNATEAIIEDTFFSKCTIKGGDERWPGVGGALHLSFDGRYTIKRCVFEENTAKDTGGALYISKIGDDLPNPQRARSIKYRSIEVQIYDSTFRNNEASKYGQAIFINDAIVQMGNVTISSFGTKIVNHLHFVGEKITMQQVDVDIKYSGEIRSSMTTDVITIRASKKFQVIGEMNFTCPRYFNAIQEKDTRESLMKLIGVDFWFVDTTTSFAGKCRSCRAYTLAQGRLSVKRIIDNFRDYLRFTVENGQCLPCPPGGSCNGDIKPVDNNWGHITADGAVQFIQCPDGYCCSTQTTPCKTYNTCAKGRSGKLCGSCAPGYTQGFVTSGCILTPGVSCDPNIFIIFFLLVSAFYTLLFAYLPSIIEALKNLIASRKQHQDSEEADDGEEKDVIIKQRRASTAEQQSEVASDTPLPISAVITLVCFFFQLASLVHVKAQFRSMKTNVSADEDQAESAFLRSLFDFFNFRFALYQKICPMNNMTLPIKESLNVALKLTSIFNLLLVFIVWKIISILISSIRQRSKGNSEIELAEVLEVKEGASIRSDTDENHSATHETQNLPFPVITKIGFIKLVKLNFTAISTFAFNMIHCVTIGKSLHLYLYGDQQCYTGWQYIVFIAVLPVVVLYPLSFGIALNFLKDRFISPSTFLFASVMPIFTLALYIKKKILGLNNHNPTTDDEICTKEILNMEEELFKEDDHLLRWPVVQLYRNLVIVLLSTFIISPIYKSVSLFPVFVVFLVHDGYRRPYKHTYLNVLQVISSACLTVINACNIPASFSVAFDLMIIPGMSFVLGTLKYIEVTMMAVVPFSFVGWKIWDKYQNRLKSKDD